jgi:carbon-monoxide dehydrogenase small subunit
MLMEYKNIKANKKVANQVPGYIRITVNGEPRELMMGKDVQPSHTLAYTIREVLGYTGTKISCDHGACGACTVLINGKPVLSCMTLTVECDGSIITTIEGLEDPKTGKLHPIQQAFIDHTAFQCGFCTPGMIMTAYGLLLKNPKMTRAQIIEGMDQNLCRCAAHKRIVQAIESVCKK